MRVVLQRDLGVGSQLHRLEVRSLLPDGAEVAIVPVEKDRYGRMVAEVWNDAIAGETNLNANLVLNGYAWHYKEYSGSCPNKDAIATAAQMGKKPQGEAPWEYGRRNR